jgi:hypothetical protein
MPLINKAALMSRLSYVHFDFANRAPSQPLFDKYHFLMLVSLVLGAMKIDNRTGLIQFDRH